MMNDTESTNREAQQESGGSPGAALLAGNESEITASCPSMGEVVNKAAKHLPPGWIIAIEVEKDGYDVKLRRPSGLSTSVDGGDGGIIGDVNEALCIANGFSS